MSFLFRFLFCVHIFVCLYYSFLSEQKGSEASPAKRAKLDLSGTPRKPKAPCTLKVSDALNQQMASLLDMPEVESPHKNYERNGAETPHSILKVWIYLTIL